MDKLFKTFYDVSGLSLEQMVALSSEAQETIEDLAVGLKGLGGLLCAAANNQDWGSINEQASNTAILIERVSEAIICCKLASANLNHHLNKPTHQQAPSRSASHQQNQGGEA